MFLGFVNLESALPLMIVTRDGSNNDQVLNADSLPTYRIYGPAGLMSNATGSFAKADTKAITGATNATPVVITSVAHGLTTGDHVTVTGLNGGGSNNANTDATITVLTANTFQLDGIVGNTNYTSGGVWNVTGLYSASFTPQAANGFVSGQTYSILVESQVNGIWRSEIHTFTVV